MTRKTLFIILILFNISTWTFSQEAIKKTHIGISFIPQLSKQGLGSDEVEGKTSRFCYVLGGDVFYDLSSRMQLKSGLSFQGAKINYRDYSPQFPGDVINGQYVPHLSYWNFNITHLFIGIPFEGKLKLSRVNKPNHFFFSGGIRVQYLLYTSGTIQLIESGNPWQNQELDSFLFEPNKIWTVINGGIGYEWKLGNGKIMINPVYEHPLTNLFKVETLARENGSIRFIGIRLAYY